jgi:type IV secretion system protein TrbL
MQVLRYRYISVLLCFLAVCALTTILPDTVAYADSTSTMLAEGTGIAGFDNTFTAFAKAMVAAAKPIVGIMTAVAGCMVVLGIQDGTKTVWNVILGVGLALNFGSFIMTAWGSYMTATDVVPTITAYDFSLKTSGDIDMLSGFMNNYTANIIVPGATAIKYISIKLLLILLLIDSTVQLSLDLISGDKMKFLIMTALKGGFYIFLIENWLGGINLMQNLSDGFQEIGFLAAGDSTKTLKPDSIVNNAIVIFNAVWSSAKGQMGINNIGLTIVDVIALIITMGCLFLTAVEMFMARIEFYTMALITIPLLPFGVCKHTEFLSQKAIGAMFNLAIKVSVIAFISAVAVPFLKTYADKMQAASTATTGTSALFTQIGLILQMVLAAFIIFMLTKKIPELVQGLLSGNPSLGGSTMTQMGMSAVAKGAAAVSTAGAAVAATSAAGAMAGGGAGGGGRPGMMMSALGGARAGMASGGVAGMAMGALKGAASGAVNTANGAKKTAANLGTLAYRQNPASKGYQGTMDSIRGQIDSFNKNARFDGIRNKGFNSSSTQTTERRTEEEPKSK